MLKNFVVLLANNANALRNALEGHRNTVTVEAEYGDEVVRGTIATLAHHGPRSNNPCPCLADNDVAKPMCSCGVGCPVDGYVGEGCDAGRTEDDLVVIGVSHLDLDTLGGIAAVLGVKYDYDKAEVGYDGPLEFWQLAAFVDVNGPHKIGEWEARRHFDAEKKWSDWKDAIDHVDAMSWNAIDSLNAWWAWSEKNRGPFAPRDGSVVDVTDYVKEAVRVLGLIAEADSFNREAEALYDAGAAFERADKDLNLNSYVRDEDGVILRHAGAFVNHLYATPGRKVCRAVVALTRRSVQEAAAVTISLADPIPGVSCREIVQKLWGPEAGGHDGIAGSPRGKDMTVGDAEEAFNAVRAALAEADKNNRG